MSAREQFVRDIPEIINVLSDYENEKKNTYSRFTDNFLSERKLWIM